MRPQFRDAGGRLLLAVSMLAPACQSTEAVDPPTPTCQLTSLDAQPQERFPSGLTYYLPTLDANCASTWALDQAPSGSANGLVVGADGWTRFTPTVPGAYRFKLGDGSATHDLRAVDALAQPFFNHNYYGTQTGAAVNGEVWFASVYRPEIVRLDPASGAEKGRLVTGSWPVAVAWQAGMTHAVVAQRGSDTLGLVDVAEARLVDAIWVGDEPASVVLTADGKTAFVTLATDAQVAVVDLETRAVTSKIDVVRDPLALALSPDGARLYVASHRSGHPSRFPFPADPAADERDLSVIDTASLSVVETFMDVGTTINGLLVSSDGQTLWVAATENDSEASLADPMQPSFRHQVLALYPSTGARKTAADLSRQATSGGYAVALHALAEGADQLYVVAESSDLVIALDKTTLEEQSRATVSGRPRHVFVDGADVWVHGPQTFMATRLDAALQTPSAFAAGTDPRPAALSFGQAYFTGAGREFAQNWACNSCHADGLTDTLIWNAGPFEDRAVPRGLSWLEGTGRLGWDGYLANVRNYAFTVSSNVGIRPVTEEAEGLNAYLASLMPPPAANGKTRRDGELSSAAQVGKELFEGKANCAGCHPLPRTTTTRVLESGITGEGIRKVPSLVGIYRYNVWMKDGSATGLQASVAQAADWLNVSLSDDETASVTRYIQEMTGRELFALRVSPAAREPARVDAPIEITFSQPVWEDATNLAKITLVDAAGAEVAVRRSVREGRYVVVTPEAMLAPATDYRLEIAADFEAVNERAIFAAESHDVRTAAAPAFRLEGEYVWTVQVPLPDFENGGFDPNRTAPIPVDFMATPTASGADLVVDFGQGLVYATHAVVDGDQLRIPPLPIAVGPGGFTDSTGLQATLTDSDSDGVADIANGATTLSGPGFVVPDVQWDVAAPDAPMPGCMEGATGSLALSVTKEAGGLVVDWDAGEAQALSLYVTDPGATLPRGPGQTVTDGETSWALAASMFPTGFEGPVTYGVVPAGADDDSVTHGAQMGGTMLEEGRCYQVSVITTRFQTSTFTLVY